MQRWLSCSIFAALVACHAVTQDPVPAGSERVVAVFAPDAAQPCLSDLPFPTDLARNPETGRVEVPFCPEDTPDLIEIKTGLRAQDGYALTTSITFRFSGEVVPESLENHVSLVALSTLEPIAHDWSYFPDRNHQVVLKPRAPLAPTATYLVVVTDGVTDPNGQPVVSDQAFTYLRSNSPLTDSLSFSRYASLDDATASSLETIRLAYQPVLEAAASLPDVSREEIVLAWTFTTTSLTMDDLFTRAAEAQNAGGAWAAHETAILAQDHLLLAATGLPFSHLCAIHTGRVLVQSFLSELDRFADNPQGPVTETPIDYLLLTPKQGSSCNNLDPGDPIPAWDGAGVVVFAHGLGRCKNDALAIADALAASGWATLSLDGPHAGSRLQNPLGDQDLDGCPDQLETPELLSSAGGDPNPFRIRDQLQEWALELSQVLDRLRTSPAEFAGQSSVTMTTRVGLVGHSWGGIAATLAAPLSTPPDAVVIHAASGGMEAVFTPLILESVAADLPTDASEAELAAGAQTGVTAFGWALETADPLLMAGHYPHPPSRLPILFQAVDPGDIDVPLHAMADQLRLLDAFGRNPASQSTFTLATEGGGHRTTICDELSLAAGNLLAPCAAPGATSSYAQAVKVQSGMQRQLVAFIDRQAICDPDPDLPCD